MNVFFFGVFLEVLMCSYDFLKEELFKKVKEKYNVICYIDDFVYYCDYVSEILCVFVYWMVWGECDNILKIV